MQHAATYIARTSNTKDTFEFDHAGDALDHIRMVMDDKGASVWKIDLDEKGEPETVRNVTQDLIEEEAERLYELGEDAAYVPAFIQPAFLELMAEGYGG